MVIKATATTIVFVMVDASFIVQTEESVAAQISKDGGAFANCSNAVSEISNGFYKVLLTSTETNADVYALKLTAEGCLQQNLIFYPDTPANFKANVSGLATSAALNTHDTEITAKLKAILGLVVAK